MQGRVGRHEWYGIRHLHWDGLLSFRWIRLDGWSGHFSILGNSTEYEVQLAFVINLLVFTFTYPQRDSGLISQGEKDLAFLY